MSNNAGGADSFDRGRFGQAAMGGFTPVGPAFFSGDRFNPDVVGGPMSGYTPSGWEEFAVEHPQLIGAIASGATGIPGIGTLMNAYINNGYWDNTAWNSSAMGGENLIGEQIPPRETLNEMINDSLAPQQSDVPVDTDAAREAARREWMTRYFDPWAFTKQPGFTGKK
jgi:hypothetical protein